MDFGDDDALSDSGSSMSMEEGDNLALGGSVRDHVEDVVDYQVLSQSNILSESNEIATETANVLGFSSHTCKILLHHFHWNRENLIERFYEAGDKDKFLSQYHVTEDVSLAKGSLTTACGICFDEGVAVYGLSCNHMFCNDCWKSYLTMKIKDEGVLFITCPGLKCETCLTESVIRSVIEDIHILNALRKLIINSFVQSNTKLKWCPAADCGKAIKVPHPECRPVKCDCGSVFCFDCSQEWHDPVSCDMLKMWLKKCSDDSETSNWLNANTKDCPQCHVTIEKDGGCNHMTCKNVACRFEFCWTCLGPWKPHGSGWYSCNRFDDTEAKKARDEQEKSRAALQRYLHYYNRFVNHQNSLKLEHKLYAQVQEKMLQMQQRGFSWIETQFLRKAVDVLSECRRTLMYTYAFAFYLKQDNMTNIFEGNQQDLELSTEQLSEFLERDLEKENLVSLKQKVQDKYRYVQQRRTALLEHVLEGREKNEWNFCSSP